MVTRLKLRLRQFIVCCKTTVSCHVRGNLKAVDTIGICQRLFFTVGVLTYAYNNEPVQI